MRAPNSGVQAEAAAVVEGKLPGVSNSKAGGDGTITLDVVVTDRAGKPVAGLEQADFAVMDNAQPETIQSFHAYGGVAQKPEQPVEVIIVFDMVNLPFDEVSYTRQQVENFLRENGGHLALPVSIDWVTDDGVEAQRAGVLDGNTLAEKIEQSEVRLRRVNRAHNGYGAIERFQFSIKMLEEMAESEKGKPGRKLVIWMGPGWPEMNGPGLEFSAKVQEEMFEQIVQMSTLLREAGVAVYSVSQGVSTQETFVYQGFLKGVTKVQQANIPNLGLGVLAVESGGLVLPPTNDMAAAINTCVQDAGAYYSLSFKAPRADGPNQYHELEVLVDKPELTARTNTGYYGQP